jgi:transposase InsO family protein
VYFLKEKSQAFETFRNFHVWIKNEAQFHIDSLHTHNGREYTPKTFERYHHQNGMKHQTKFPYNPQQNGVAKIMNKTLLNVVRVGIFTNTERLGGGGGGG